ncbi:MAG: SDR family NAD(P)-dependent oxidoreductase [Flavobacterium sp.]
MKLKGKIALVTGASKGIGVAIAKKLAAEGASVAVNYSSDKAGAERTVSEIEAIGGKAVAVQGSVADAQDVVRIFSETAAAFGKIDILVNNAGVYAFQLIEEVTIDEYQRQFGINVLGPILTAKEALKYFPAEGGSIINISSVISESPSPGTAVYSSTKGALDTLTRQLAAELAPKNIRVNTVSPGLTATEGGDTAGIRGSEMEKNIIAGTPLGRIGQPEDIAGAVAFLAGEDSAWITGERINAAGGLR